MTDPGPQKKSEINLLPGSTKAPTPAVVKEKGKAENAIARTRFGGMVLLTLCALLAFSIWQKSDLGSAIVAAISAGLGFLLGERTKQED